MYEDYLGNLFEMWVFVVYFGDLDLMGFSNVYFKEVCMVNWRLLVEYVLRIIFLECI